MTSILFVCTGNICRSPSADGIMRHMATQRGLNLTIDSCGTQGWHIGNPPDPRTIAAAKKNGIDLSSLAARQLAVEDFETFDYLYAMDNGHLAAMFKLCPPEHAHKLHLFLDALPDHQGEDTPDPYYGDLEGFDTVYDLIHKGCEAILNHTIKP